MIRRGARVCASVACTAALVLTPVAGIAAAQSVLGAPSAAAAPTAAPGAPEPQTAAELDLVPNPAPTHARVSIDEITPQVADGAPGSDAINGIPLVTVRGTVTNASDEEITDLTLRLQRGPGTSEPSQVRAALSAPEQDFETAGPFEPLADALAPGAEAPFEVKMPLSEANNGPSLQIDQPGVYPLLVNVNGTPAGGSAARLDDARVLLPVMPSALQLLPGAAGTELASRAETSPASDVTVVYPIAAAPTRRAISPGLDGPAPTVHLTDDSLLTSLGDGGRLSGLLDALEDAEQSNDELSTAVCLAVDPELLRTTADIADGLEVIVDGPEEAERISDAAPMASAWLDRLRELAGDHCTVPLPPNQADLDAVAATQSNALASAVGDGPANELTRVLGVESTTDAVIPTSGTITQPTVDQIPALRDSPLVVASSAVSTPDSAIPRSGVHRLESGQHALAYDPYLASSLAATGAIAENPRYSSANQRYWLESDSPAARLQSARASLLAPVLANMSEAADSGPDIEAEAAPDAEAGESPEDTSDEARKLLVMPPAVWTLDDDGVQSLLDTVSGQIEAGNMRPLSLGDALAQAPDEEPVRLDSTRQGLPITPDTLGREPAREEDAETPASDASDRSEIERFLPTGAGGQPIADSDPGAIDTDTIARVGDAMVRVSTLRHVVDTSDPTSHIAPAFIDPLRSEALRTLSTTARRAGGDGSIESHGFDADDPLAGPDTGRTARQASADSLDRLENALDNAFESISLIPPGAVYTMASPNSPLLLVARNGMPFPVRVSVQIDTPPGITVENQGIISVPASGSRTMQLPTDSEQSGTRAGITMQLVSPDGVALSEPIDIEVQTGGSRLAWLFMFVAGIAAVVLMFRRFLTVRRAKADGTWEDPSTGYPSDPDGERAEPSHGEGSK